MIETKESKKLREEASADLEKAQESFERCDTDGFLSQWALGLGSQKKSAQAKILENGGKSEFLGLYDAVGTRVPAKLIRGKFGPVWLLRDDVEKSFGRKFIPSSHGASRIQKALGLKELAEIAPARAIITGTGHGLSGRAWVEEIRIGDEWGLDAVLLTEG